jgi:hypothetical protein
MRVSSTFLFDVLRKYVCEQLFDIIGKDPVFAAGDVTKVDDGQLWRDIFESSRLREIEQKAPARRV